MITESLMYWLTRVDHIREILFVISVIGVILGLLLFIIGMIAIAVAHNQDNDSNKKFWKRAVFVSMCLLAVTIVVSVGRAFIPTTQEYAAIKVIPVVANNEDLRELGSEIPKLAREWLEELRPKKEKKLPQEK